MQSPPKGDTLIYKPKQVAAAVNSNSFPIIFANGQVYQVQGQYAIPLPPHEVCIKWLLNNQQIFTIIILKVAKLVQMGALGQISPTAPIQAPGVYIFLNFVFTCIKFNIAVISVSDINIFILIIYSLNLIYILQLAVFFFLFLFFLYIIETKVCVKAYGAYPQILAPIITPLPPSGNFHFSANVESLSLTDP